MRRLLAIVLLLAAGAVTLLFLQAREPAWEGPGGFDLVRFFDGAATSQGTITTLLVRREAFTARFRGEAGADEIVLEERFQFAAGERLQRWRLRASGEGYEGTVETEGADGRLAPPVPVRGVAGPEGVVLDYRGFAPGGGERLFHFRHRMRMLRDGTVRNHVVVTAFGLPLATSTVLFSREGAALPSPSGER